MLRRVQIIILFLIVFISHGECYQQSPDVPDYVWEQVEPYFLPEDHPIKKKLDKIFKKSRVIANKESYKKAGFSVAGRGHSGIKVLFHRKVKGYVIKTYLDEQVEACDWSCWVRRIEGAEHVRQAIEENQCKWIKVPKKWIYPLPLVPLPEEGHEGKHFILIAENMLPLDTSENAYNYRHKMKPKHMDELFAVMEAVGFHDCYPVNMPWCMDGKIAFVDVYHWGHWPINYKKRLRPYLSPYMQDYLDELIRAAS